MTTKPERTVRVQVQVGAMWCLLSSSRWQHILRQKSDIYSALTEHELPGQLGGQHLAVVGEVAGVRRRVVYQSLGRLRRLQLSLLLQRGVRPGAGGGGDGPVGALEGGLVHGGDRLRAHQRGRVEAHLVG